MVVKCNTKFLYVFCIELLDKLSIYRVFPCRLIHELIDVDSIPNLIFIGARYKYDYQARRTLSSAQCQIYL